jgi:tRNA(fMet)-specific endonuclease VapC
MSKRGELLLLDTSVLLHLVRGNELGQHIDSQLGLRSRPERALISVITVGESLAFAARLGWGEKKRTELDLLLRELVIVDINNGSVLRAYADIDAYLKKQGKSLSNNDVWIAATCHAAGALLLTCDKDFDALDPEFIKRRLIPSEREK